MGHFSAHVQYDDWTGTAAADAADHGDIRKFAVEKGLLSDHEFFVGFEFYSGGKIGAQARYFAARIYVIDARDYEGAVKELASKEPVPVHVRELELGLEEFFDLFKRFSVVLTQRGLDLDGREFAAINSGR